MILQPLVENSITHAISSRPEGGTIEIRARAVDGSVLLQVIDDGGGSSQSAGSGIGLTNTVARLRHLHGDGASLQMRNEHNRFIVEVQVPMAVEKARA
jgi:LytS/YehU family sensor histidine kinase